MIVYSGTKNTFLEDASSGIEDKMRLCVKNMLNIDIKPGSSEYDSWKNSLGNAMFHVMNTDKIPDDSGVAIEYSIPRTKNRIDFIITGQDEVGKEKVIIIELKQWTDIEITEKDAMVMTRFRHGVSEELHPSYQAWSYSTLLKGFNATVYEGNIDLVPCAYLHNYVENCVITNFFYGDYLQKAPAFCKGDKEQLQDFIAKYVKYGDKKNTIYRIDNGEIRPSKDLADSLVSMIKGNQEFVMIDDQKIVYETALALAKHSSKTNKNILIVEGGPGTGKSVVAINLLVATTKMGLNTQYVTKNSAPRAVFEAKLTGIKTKSAISNMFTGSGSYIDRKNTFHALIVDEAHRLNEKSGIMKNRGENQIKEIIEAANCAVFFIDEDQRVTWQDIGETKEILKWAKKIGVKTYNLKLESQFRCNGSDGYLSWIDDVFQIRETANKSLDGVEYDFRVCDSPEELQNIIFERNRINNKARLVAGYCWNWISKKNKDLKDIDIPEYGFKMKWNLASDGNLWIISPKSVNEIGCIHTCQGLEVDYIGVIIGPDLLVREGIVLTDPSKRASNDKSLHGYKKALKINPKDAALKADKIIRNTYRTLLTRGMKGCYIYCVDQELSKHIKSRIPPAEFQRDIVPVNANKIPIPVEVLSHIQDPEKYKTHLPVYSLQAAAGKFGDGSDVRAEGWVKAEIDKRLNDKMFVAKIVGHSMEPLIPNNSYCIFKLGVVGSRQGKIILVQHRDVYDSETGGSYTVKKYTSKKKYNPNGSWEHEEIILLPLNSAYKPIIIPNIEEGEFKVIAEFVDVL